MTRSRAIAIAVTLCCLVSCNQTTTGPAAPPSAVTPEGTSPIAGATVVVPAGSTDALAGAIAAAGRHGRVIVAAGVHHESASLLITKPVSIKGQPGAIIEFGTTADPAAVATIDADFHIKNTRDVSIEGLDLRAPSGHISGTAFLVDHSTGCRVERNNITGHQYGVIVLYGDRARIDGNTIDVVTDWQTGGLIDAEGIIVVSGAKVQVVGNTISNGVFGIWCCDREGLCANNNTSACFVGIILCTVPQGSFIVDGTAYGADLSCTRWLVRDNVGSANFTAGLLVIDNANNNRVVNNSGSANGTYDIEMVGDSFRFGFLTPTSYDNLLVVGEHHEAKIKDCGLNNRIVGRADNMVDNDQDPCF